MSKMVRESVVCITIQDRAGTEYGCPTGFYVNQIGTVLTSAYVVEDVRSIRVINDSGRNLAYRVSRQLDHSQAVLLVPSSGRVQSQAVSIAQSAAQGEPVVIIGFPENLVQDSLVGVMPGYLVATGQWGTGVRALHYHVLETIIRPGMSGSPVINGTGDVIGFIELGDPDGGSFSYAVDITGESFP